MKYHLLVILFAFAIVGCEPTTDDENSTTEAGYSESEIAERFREVLSGPSLEEVDYRQLEEYQGLLYKVGSNDPFNGIVKNQPFARLMEGITGTCQVTIEGGLPNGLSTCYDQNMNKVSETTYADGRKHGPETLWDPETQNRKRFSTWTYDQLGLQREYDSKTGKPTVEFHVENGHKVGVEKRWWSSQGQDFYAEIEYKYSDRDGFTKIWDEDSRLIAQDMYEDGIIRSSFRQTWGPDGKITSQKSLVPEDPNYSGLWPYVEGWPKPKLVKHGKQYECKETHSCHESEWDMGVLVN